MHILKPRFQIDSKIQKICSTLSECSGNRFNSDKITQCAHFYEHNIKQISRLIQLFLEI